MPPPQTTPSSAAPPTLPPTHTGAAKAAQLLADGHLVALPTETVYGIGFSLNSPAARSLAASLQHSLAPSQPAGIPHWVLHLKDTAAALDWAPNLSPLARRVVTKSLPAPVAYRVTLSAEDLQSAEGRLADAAPEVVKSGALTLRVPDHTFTQEVLSRANVPVAIFGTGVFDLSDLPESLLPHLGATVDDGPTRYRKPSTLMALDNPRGTLSLLRPGVIDRRILQKLADFTVVFVCSGNTCRSPMAAALATRLAADRLHVEPKELPLRHLVIQSAGVHANRGMRAAREALEIVRDYKADLSAHFSQPASLDVLRRADVIYTMTDAHREEILHIWPAASEKTHLADPEGEIPDPIGAGMQAYRDVAERLQQVLQKRLDEWPI